MRRAQALHPTTLSSRSEFSDALLSDPVKQPYVVSTKGFHRRACTSAAANVTRWSLNVAAADLRSKLEKLPSSRSFETWPLYLAAILPLMKLRVEAHQRKCVRRARFRNYMKRDREIDRVCQDLCGGQAFVPSGLRPLGARGPAPEGLRPGRGPKLLMSLHRFHTVRDMRARSGKIYGSLQNGGRIQHDLIRGIRPLCNQHKTTNIDRGRNQEVSSKSTAQELINTLSTRK